MMLPLAIRVIEKTKIDEEAKGKGGLRYQRLSNESETVQLGPGVQPASTWRLFFHLGLRVEIIGLRRSVIVGLL